MHTVTIQLIEAGPGVRSESKRNFDTEHEAVHYASDLANQLGDLHLDATEGDYFEWEHDTDPTTVMCTEIYIDSKSYYWIAVTK